MKAITRRTWAILPGGPARLKLVTGTTSPALSDSLYMHPFVKLPALGKQHLIIGSKRPYATISDKAFDFLSDFDAPPQPLPSRQRKLARASASRLSAAEDSKDTPEIQERDDEGNVAAEYADLEQTTAPIATPHSLPPGLKQTAENQAQPLNVGDGAKVKPATKRKRKQATVKASPPDTDAFDIQPKLAVSTVTSKGADKFDFVAAKRAPPYLVKKPFSETSFEDFRKYHRQKMWDPKYEVSPATMLANAEDPNRIPQPHDLPLASRYDWRLRAPSRSAAQKEAYGMRTIWRKKMEEKPVPDPEGDYAAYKSQFDRFIQLERDCAEAAALARLSKAAQSTGARSRKTPAAGGTVEHLIGLKGRARQPRSQPSVSTPTSADRGNSPEPAPWDNTETEISLRADEEWAELDEDYKDFRRVNTPVSQVSFSLPDDADFQSNDFRRGKIVFIWNCQTHPYTDELYVPELEDRNLSLEELRKLPTIGFVEKAYLNRIDITCPVSFKPSDSQLFRLDIGYDDTSFRRMEDALQKLARDAAHEREINLALNPGPSIRARNIEVQGTEVRDLVLEGFARSQAAMANNTTITSPSESFVSFDSIFMQDQYICSWAKRYARRHPM